MAHRVHGVHPRTLDVLAGAGAAAARRAAGIANFLTARWRRWWRRWLRRTDWRRRSLSTAVLPDDAYLGCVAARDGPRAADVG